MLQEAQGQGEGSRRARPQQELQSTTSSSAEEHPTGGNERTESNLKWSERAGSRIRLQQVLRSPARGLSSQRGKWRDCHSETKRSQTCRNKREHGRGIDTDGSSAGGEPRRGKTGHQVQSAALRQQDPFNKRLNKRGGRDTPLSNSGVEPRLEPTRTCD